MKLKQILAVVGLFVVFVGVALIFSRAQAVANARARDAVDTGSTRPEEQADCRQPLVAVDLPERVMSEDREQTLTVTVGNQFNSSTCVVIVELTALRFDISPTTLVRTSAELALGETESFIWLIAPTRTGEHTIIVMANEELQTLGVTVRTWLGLTAGQARVASFVATLLGPLLSVPWWLERWEKRQQANRPPSSATAV